MAKTERTEEELLPSGHQAPKTQSHIIYRTHLINCNTHHSPSSALLLCVHTRYNLFAHSSCTSLVILIFIKSTVDCIAHFTPYFILLFLLIFFFILFLPIFKYMLLCYVSSFIFILFALSIERTCPDLHFTTDYTLYDCVCDK